MERTTAIFRKRGEHHQRGREQRQQPDEESSSAGRSAMAAPGESGFTLVRSTWSGGSPRAAGGASAPGAIGCTASRSWTAPPPKPTSIGAAVDLEQRHPRVARERLARDHRQPARGRRAAPAWPGPAAASAPMAAGRGAGAERGGGELPGRERQAQRHGRRPRPRRQRARVHPRGSASQRITAPPPATRSARRPQPSTSTSSPRAMARSPARSVTCPLRSTQSGRMAPGASRASSASGSSTRHSSTSSVTGICAVRVDMLDLLAVEIRPGSRRPAAR